VLNNYTEMLKKYNKNEPLETSTLYSAFYSAFKKCNDELSKGPIDTRFSGSTCVSILILGQKLFCSNVGDSRGIVVKKKKGICTKQGIP